ncbi:hypothetical protein HDU97_006748 [Phlyctochytrium planicorne]|nr:hypothetical protein HDU97_006748 [Phlyctochytrium planicorne]
MISLTLSLAQESSGKSKTVSSNIQKLAVATGAPDWEGKSPLPILPLPLPNPYLTIDDGKTLFIQGEKYLLGLGVPKSPDLAFKRYLASSKCGQPDAMNMLGHLHENGLGCPKDVGAAIRWYKEAATLGNSTSMANLGRILEEGIGVPIDHVQAGEWYLRAAERGNLDGMVNIGYLLENGIGRDASPTLASEWYRMAATQSHPRAQNALGSCYYRGRGVDQDYNEAVFWFKRAVEQGYAQAQNNLGICYEEGLGVAKDVVMAKALYKAASESKHASGTNNYGFLLMMEEKWFEAFKYFNVAWSLGSADAAYNLGSMYESGCEDSTGPIIKPDLDIAFRWHREGAMRDSPKSQVRFASLLLQHPGYPADTQLRLKYLKESETYLRRAAEGGSTDAQTLLGQMLEIGITSEGESPDPEQAVQWYKRAAERGHAGSLFHLAACVEGGVGGVRQDHEKAVKLYEEAKKKGSQEAKTRLDDLRSLTDLTSNSNLKSTSNSNQRPLSSTPNLTTTSSGQKRHQRGTSGGGGGFTKINNAVGPVDSGKLVSIDSWPSVMDT